MKELERRLRRVEAAADRGTVALISENTGRVMCRMKASDSITVLIAWMKEELAREEGTPLDPTDCISTTPLWSALAEAEPFAPGAGELMECIRVAAHEWASEVADSGK